MTRPKMSKAATLRQLRRILLVAIILLSGGWSLAKAQNHNWDVYATVDNLGTVYFGTSTQTVGAPVGVMNNWIQEFHFQTSQPPNAYLYVATASDQSAAQGFVGIFTNTTLGSTALTGNPAWEVFPAGKYAIQLGITNPWPPSTQPTQVQVDAAITYATANNLWVSPTTAPGYDLDPATPTSPYGYPWGYNHWPNIPNAAQWIWFESGLVPGVTYPSPFQGGNHQEFLVFRIAGEISADSDAWIQDYNPCDDGTEPDPCPGTSTPMWMSDDIRVRNSNTTTPFSLPHQNPIAGVTNYVYVKLRSRGTMPVCGKIKVYWAYAASGLAWNFVTGNWMGAPVTGDIIGTSPVIFLGPSPDEDVAEFTWIPPSTGHICLLARFESLSPYADPMTFVEGSDIWLNTAQNNNIAWKNLIVVPLVEPIDPIYFLARNVNDFTANVDLEFNAAGGGDGIPFLEGGSVRVVLSPEMFSNWMGAGGIGQGISVNPTDSSISLTSTLAKIQGIPMGANETQPMKMNFSANSGNLTPAFQWFVVSQFSDGKTTPDGGITFEFRSGTGDIPTLSEWGMIIFGVLLLGFISWVFLRRRKAAVSLR